MFKEFKEFAMKGNVVDMAVGVIIGAAFGKIVTSLVNDVVMPPLGLVIGKIDFSNLFYVFAAPEAKKDIVSLDALKASGLPAIRYGLFINNIIDFLIVAFAI